MKKRSLILITICLAAALLAVSCHEASFDEALVSVRFDGSSSRALAASLESFADNAESYYWAYEAKKADSSKLTRGQTETYGGTFVPASANWVSYDVSGNPKNGIAGVTLSGFSQGKWSFMLYACKRSGSGTDLDPYVYSLVYKGENPAVFLYNSYTNEGADPNVISVSVSPVKDSGNGTLSVLWSDIAAASTKYSEQIKKVQIGYVLRQTGQETVVFNDVTEPFSDSLVPGTYTVKIRLILDELGESYAESTIVVTVYSNLTTTVDGSVS